MNKKNFMDMMICSLSAAIIILCFTYMEQSRGRDTLMAVCGIVFLAFLLLAVTDSLSGRQKKRGNGRGIQELLLLDEEGNEISAWHIGGKTSLLIGRDEHKENVDINLQNTEYGGMADRQHAVCFSLFIIIRRLCRLISVVAVDRDNCLTFLCVTDIDECCLDC